MIKLTTPSPAPSASPAPTPPPAVTPMSSPSGGPVAHKQTVTSAEGVRQTAVAGAAGNVASIKAAEIAFHRAVVASAIANNNGAGIGPSMQALRDLGVTGI